jgi:hypothetical protein
MSAHPNSVEISGHRRPAHASSFEEAEQAVLGAPCMLDRSAWVNMLGDVVVAENFFSAPITRSSSRASPR